MDVGTDFDTVIEQCCNFLEFLETPNSNTGEIYLNVSLLSLSTVV